MGLKYEPFSYLSGGNGYGQLGIGPSADCRTPTPVCLAHGLQVCFPLLQNLIIFFEPPVSIFSAHPRCLAWGAGKLIHARPFEPQSKVDF